MAIIGTGNSAVNDRVLFRHWQDFDRPLTLAADGESFTFADRALIRIGRESVEVSGDLRQMKLRVASKPELRLNGQLKTARFVEGFLVFDAADQ